MKIMVTVSDQAWGGKHQFMYDVADGLQRRGHAVSVVCEQGSRMQRRYEAAAQPHHATPPFATQPQAAAQDLETLLGGPEQPDVLLVTGRYDAEAARRVLAASGTRPGLVLFRHSAFPLANDEETDELLSMVDVVVATSLEQARRQFDGRVAAGLLRSEQVQIMASSVPPALLERLGQLDRQAERDALGLDAEAFVFLVPARLSWEKGVDRVVAAFAALPEELRELAVVAVAGEGPEEASLLAQCAAAGVGGSVVFLGHHDDMAPLYAAADAVVLATTVPETGPLALKEGMAAGLPVIASRTGGIPEFVVDGVHGFLVDDDEQLAAAFDRLIRDEALAGSLGAKARSDVVHKHLLGPRLDHLELLLAALHLRGDDRADALQSYTWADVRMKEESDRGLVYVPATSLITVLEGPAFAAVVDAVDRRDVALLDDPRVDQLVVRHLLQMGALVAQRDPSVSADRPR